MKPKLKNLKFGFTLAELVVALGIMSIVALITAYFYQLYNESSNNTYMYKMADLQNQAILTMIKKSLNKRIMNPPGVANPPPSVSPPSFGYTLELQPPPSSSPASQCSPLRVRGRIVDKNTGETTSYRITTIETICANGLGFGESEYQKMGGMAAKCNSTNEPGKERPMVVIKVWNDESKFPNDADASHIYSYPPDVPETQETIGPNPQVLAAQVCITPVPPPDPINNLLNLNGLTIEVSSAFAKNKTTLEVIREKADFNLDYIALRQSSASYPFFEIEQNMFEAVEFE